MAAKGKPRKSTKKAKDLQPRAKDTSSVKGGLGGGPINPVKRVKEKIGRLPPLTH